MAAETDRSPRAALAEIARHARGDELAALVHALAFSAFDERRVALDHGLDEAAARQGLDAESGETGFGNALAALRHGPRATAPERTLLGALLTRGVALSPPSGIEAEDRVAEALAWLAAHTPLDGLSSLEPALGERARGLFRALAALVSREDEGVVTPAGRAGAIVALAALAHAEGGRTEVAALRGSLRDPLLARLVAEARPAEAPGGLSVQAELGPPTRGPVATFLLTVTFLLPLIAVVRLFARYVLGLRRPAEVVFTASGVVVRARTELLGRTLRDREWVVPAGGLSRAAREVRYAGLPTYAGIAALLLGSYVGLRLVLDGVRAGSPPLLAQGLVVLLVGLLVDWWLVRRPARSPRGARLVLEPHAGARIVLDGVDRGVADAALQRLAKG